jgi:hypothetical protein
MSYLNANTKAYHIIDAIETHYQEIVKTLYEQKLSTQKALNETQTARLECEQVKKELADLQNTLKDATVVDNSANLIASDDKVTELKIQNEALEEKYQATYQLLQKEMVKVDTIQMELELAQRERDIALRKQSISPEQKQLLIKLEHENYNIKEAIERIDYISQSLKQILNDSDISKDIINLQKDTTQV